MIYAFNCFCMETHNGSRPTSHLYEYARRLYVEMLKKTDTWKKKMGKSMKQLVWMKNNKGDVLRIHTNSVDKYIKMGYERGRIIKHRISPSPETIQKQINSHKGKTLSTKGKTWEEIYGKKTALRMRKIREQQIKNRNK